jgi:hypothetical protein
VEAAPKTDVCWLYAIIAGREYIKFGIASDIKQRLSSIQSSCPIACRIVAGLRCRDKVSALYIERRVHEILQPFSTSGEWFNFNDETSRMARRIIESADESDFRGTLLNWESDAAEIDAMLGYASRDEFAARISKRSL